MENRDSLIKELDVKIDILMKKYANAKAEAAQIRQQLNLREEENAMLRQTVSDIKAAKLLSLGKRDIRKTHTDISRMIREIDQCIAKLSI